MPTVAVVGASGYAGQETLDRVLTHSALELYALGSDSLAGQAAVVLDHGSAVTAAAGSPVSSRTMRPSRAAPT